MSLPPVLLVGCGRMGQALAGGWREEGLAPSWTVDPAGCGTAGLPCARSLDEVPAAFAPEAVVLAVKPQTADEVLPRLAPYAGRVVFLSIMAGRRLGGLSAVLGGAVVRAMPNTPASVRRAITVACAGPDVSAGQKSLCDRLLGAVGSVEWTDREEALDAVTAVSGGGPAYVFLLAELLEQAGVAQGLPMKLARRLARETVSGAGALLEASGEDAAALRQAVTSPNGTTEQAVAVLMRSWPDAMRTAIAAATARSVALST